MVMTVTTVAEPEGLTSLIPKHAILHSRELVQATPNFLKNYIADILPSPSRFFKGCFQRGFLTKILNAFFVSSIQPQAQFIVDPYISLSQQH
jgi:hypothetical protein